MMKKLLSVVFAFSTIAVMSQDPILQKNDAVIESVALKLTKTYDDQLGLDGKQFVLFQKKVEEFLIREEKIHNNYNGKAKLDMITNLRIKETQEMRDILTQPQLDLYKRIKPQIQPIARIRD